MIERAREHAEEGVKVSMNLEKRMTRNNDAKGVIKDAKFSIYGNKISKR